MSSDDHNLIKAHRLETISRLIKTYAWDKEIHLRGSSVKILALCAASFLALASELVFHYHLGSLPAILSAKTITIYDNVEDVLVSDVSGPIAKALIIATIFRVVFSASIALLDIVFYKKITGKDFDYEAMINFAIVNLVFIFAFILVFINPTITYLISLYVSALRAVPTIVQLNGAAALIAACLIGDFCFYWSHRWGHGVRFFWNLGHINHHRSEKLSIYAMPDGCCRRPWFSTLWLIRRTRSSSPISRHVHACFVCCDGYSSRRGCISPTMRERSSSIYVTDRISGRD
jgi:hypothetical protein